MARKGGSSRKTERLEWRHANYFEVGHNAFEFVLDFGQFYAESKKVRRHTRIVTAPAYAKALLETLRRSIEQYEQTCGTTKENGDKETGMPDEEIS